MKTAQSIACAVMLALAVSTTTFAKSGTISGTKNGTISGTRSGTISGTRNGTISATSSGVSPTGPTTQIDLLKFGIFEFLLTLRLW